LQSPEREATFLSFPRKQFEEAYVPINDFQRVQPELAWLTGSSVASFISKSRSLRSMAHRSLFFCHKHQIVQHMHEATGVLAGEREQDKKYDPHPSWIEIPLKCAKIQMASKPACLGSYPRESG
jgi:hypothetical protein